MTADKTSDFRQAAERALDFLAAHVDANGRSRIDPSDPGLHFKLPYVFAYGDRRQLALRVLGHIEHNLLADDGAFQDDRFNGPASAFLYQAGWLAWSSAALGRFDLARRVARRAMQEQDPNLGGFWNETDQGREQGVLNSSSAAAGCAAAGEVEAAEGAAAYMARLLELQPEPDRRFHFGLNAQGAVITDSDAETGRNYFDLNGPCRPAMFATAIAGLTWLGRQTDEARYFDLASGLYQRHPVAPGPAVRLAVRLQDRLGSAATQRQPARPRAHGICRGRGAALPRTPTSGRQRGPDRLAGNGRRRSAAAAPGQPVRLVADGSRVGQRRGVALPTAPRDFTAKPMQFGR